MNVENPFNFPVSRRGVLKAAGAALGLVAIRRALDDLRHPAAVQAAGAEEVVYEGGLNTVDPCTGQPLSVFGRVHIVDAPNDGNWIVNDKLEGTYANGDPVVIKQRYRGVKRISPTTLTGKFTNMFQGEDYNGFQTGIFTASRETGATDTIGTINFSVVNKRCVRKGN